jgi:mevalonate kinase
MNIVELGRETVQNVDETKGDKLFFGQGKLLLTGEYFVLDGVKSLALPTTVGQSMFVHYSESYSPVLHWKSFDVHGNLWFEEKFEFWKFNFVDNEAPSEEAIVLQNILRNARKQNPHFLRDEIGVNVETKLGFPLEWGLGSSSTLIYNIAQWAYISPFELLFNTYGGSGYDIACAQSEGPIVYNKKSSGPNWSPITFEPKFVNQLYFVHLGRKQSSSDAVKYYYEKKAANKDIVKQLTHLTEQIETCNDFDKFETYIQEHENIISEALQLKKVKDVYFSDYWGQVKSLGAWGGDFALVTTNESAAKTYNYFKEKGFEVIIPYCDLVLGQTKEAGELTNDGPENELLN